MFLAAGKITLDYVYNSMNSQDSRLFRVRVLYNIGNALSVSVLPVKGAFKRVILSNRKCYQ
jgi:hypothetical protein